MDDRKEAETDFDFVKFFNTLEHDEEVIKFFWRKSYECYYVHGNDAVFISQEFFSGDNSLKYWSNAVKSKTAPQKKQKVEKKGLPMLSIRHGIEFESILRQLLFDKHKRVHVYKSKKTGWYIAQKGSPGNPEQFEEELFTTVDMKDVSITMAVQLSTVGGKFSFGIAQGDSGMRQLAICNFEDDQKFSNFESLLVQTGVKECLIPKSETSNYDFTKIKKILEKCNVPFAEIERKLFNGKDIKQDIARLIGDDFGEFSELDMKETKEALACVIGHLELLADDWNLGHYKLNSFNLKEYMRLDNAAMMSLNLIPSPLQSGKNMNLFDLLNKCKTAMGSRKLMQMIKQPLLDVKKITERQNIIESFLEDNLFALGLRDDSLKLVPDLDRISKKIVAHSKMSRPLEDTVTLYQTVEKLSDVIQSLNVYTGKYRSLIKEKFIQKLEDLIDGFEQFLAMVEQTIDLEHAQDAHEFLIKTDWDEELQNIQSKKKKILSAMVKIKEKTAIKLKLKENGIQLKTTPKEGYHLYGSKKILHPKIVDNKDYFVLGVQKTMLKFRTEDLIKLSSTYTELQTRYDEKQNSIVKKVLEIVVTYIPLVETLSEIFAELDVFSTLAFVASSVSNGKKEFIRPKLHKLGEGNTILIQSRHPCLEAQDDIEFIPNDVQFIREESMFHIITGPNMGGKSTYIRQVGVIILMAQIGSFVPCDSAEISLVDCILCRVGAGDSQLRGVSTFMAEMLEMSTILETATDKSLLIIDELGRGTSTYDGFGLAWAISEKICKDIRAFAFFATHFHELTALENHIPVVKNSHVEAETNNNSLTLLYNVKDGPSDQSFGIHVAQLAEFPNSVVKDAQKKTVELESFGNQNQDEMETDEKEEGERIVTDFINRIKETDLRSKEPQEVVETVNSLTAEIEAYGIENRYVAALLE